MRTQNQPCLVQSPFITFKALNKAIVLGACLVPHSRSALEKGDELRSKGIAGAASQSPLRPPARLTPQVSGVAHRTK